MPPIIYCIKRIKTVSDEILRGKKTRGAFGTWSESSLKRFLSTYVHYKLLKII